MSETKLKHLEMIQMIVNRMAGNSFLIKGWSITLVSALFALAAKDADTRYVLISYFPAIIFWSLDGYFLFQERLFRSLFDKVRISQELESDFSMNTTGLENGPATWLSATFSKTILSFHGVVFFTICIVMFGLTKG